MKQIYMFYVHDMNITASEYPGIDYKDIIHNYDGDYAFYAWTNDKFIRKTFKRLRKSSLFIERVFKTSDNDYETFENNNPDTKLLTIPITAKSDDNTSNIAYTPLIISTRREMDYIIFHQDTIIEEILSPDRFSIDLRFIMPNCFNKPYKKCLSVSGFNNLIKLLYSDKIDDRKTLDMNFDMLSLYISIYKDLYKEEIL